MKNRHTKNNKKKLPRNPNPIAKYGPRLNKPKIIQGKKSQGPKPEEWD